MKLIAMIYRPFCELVKLYVLPLNRQFLLIPNGINEFVYRRH
jgi:hypothetical protein